MKKHPNEAVLTALSRKLADDGRLIEAGFVSLQLAAIASDAPKIQIDEMRMAFMAGAQHLFASITTIMDADREPTANDIRRMALISDELARYAEILKRDLVTQGTMQ